MSPLRAGKLKRSQGLLAVSFATAFGATVIVGIAAHKASLQAILRERGVQTAASVTRVEFHPAAGDTSAYYDVTMTYEADGRQLTERFPWSRSVHEGDVLDVLYDSEDVTTVRPLSFLAEDDWQVAMGVGGVCYAGAIVALVLSRRAARKQRSS